MGALVLACPSLPAKRLRARRALPSLERLEERHVFAVFLSVSDAATVERPDGAELVFLVHRAGEVNQAVDVRYTVSAAGPGTAFAPRTGTVLLPAGAEAAAIRVPVADDADALDEAVRLVIDEATARGPWFGNPLSTGLSAVEAETADVNRDGLPDLLLLCQELDAVAVSLGRAGPAGEVSLSAPAFFPVGDGPVAMAAGDLNGDGAPDLAVANANGGTTTLLVNTTAPNAATPSFAAAPELNVGPLPFGLALGDVDGDGAQDLVVLSLHCGDPFVRVFRNTTAGSSCLTFDPGLNRALSDFPWSVRVGDLNGDGRGDLVLSSPGTNRIGVFMSREVEGQLALSPRFDFPVASGPAGLSLGDVNGDGTLDVLAGHVSRPEMSLLVNTTPVGAATPSFAPEQVIGAGHGPRVVMLADLDGDGRLDAVSANRGDRTVSVRLNRTPAARFVPVFGEELVFPAAGPPASLAHADLNGDGAADVVLGVFGGPWVLLPSSLTDVILLDRTGVGLVLDDDLATAKVAGRTVIAAANALADQTVIAVTGVSLLDRTGVGLLDDALATAKAAGRTVIAAANALANQTVIAVLAGVGKVGLAVGVVANAAPAPAGVGSPSAVESVRPGAGQGVAASGGSGSAGGSEGASPPSAPPAAAPPAPAPARGPAFTNVRVAAQGVARQQDNSIDDQDRQALELAGVDAGDATGENAGPARPGAPRRRGWRGPGPAGQAETVDEWMQEEESPFRARYRGFVTRVAWMAIIVPALVRGARKLREGE